MNYQDLKDYLFEIADKKYAEFSKSLSASDYVSIGVKNPILRKIIKDHKNDVDLDTSCFELGKYLEIDFIYFGLSLSRCQTLKEQLNFLNKNIKKAKSWAITDCVTTFLKKSTFDDFLTFYLHSYNSPFIFERRFCYVFGLKYSKNPRILDIFPKFTLKDEYMVMMAEAWLLATVAIDFPDQVYDFLKSINDYRLIRKTISKMCDSYRINNEVKIRFKELRTSKKELTKISDF